MKWRKKIRADAETGTPYKDDDGIWRLDNVPICSTGIEYKLSSGPHTFTESDLADAVEAANGDVAINPPRLKLGHSSKANDLFLGEDEPAFGRVEGMRLSDNKQTVIGDFVGTPEWLAKILPVAYPSRSIDASVGVETVTGKKYGMVINDVSLLGVRWPGCSTLEDLPLWYGSEQPAAAEITAAVDTQLIRSKFYKQSDNLFSWIRGERFDSEDGMTLIVDDGGGEISRVSVTVDGDEITFGDPVDVVERFEDKAVAASAVIAGMKMADPAMVIHASRADTAPDNSTQEGEAMDEAMRLALAKRLGLPEDATEEQIKTTLSEPVPDETPAEGDDDSSTEEETTEEETTEEAPATTGTVTLDRETYNQLKAGAALAVKHEKERTDDRVKATVEAAVNDGRIPPARRKHWADALRADFDGNKAVLDGLEKGLIPVGARGSSGDGGEEGNQPSEGEGLPESWFPRGTFKAIRAAADSDRRVINAKEG